MDGGKDENFLTYLRFPRISKHQLNASQREYELANMKGRLRKFPIIHLLLPYFIVLSEKMCFTAKIFNMHI